MKTILIILFTVLMGCSGMSPEPSSLLINQQQIQSYLVSSCDRVTLVDYAPQTAFAHVDTVSVFECDGYVFFKGTMQAPDEEDYDGTYGVWEVLGSVPAGFEPAITDTIEGEMWITDSNGPRRISTSILRVNTSGNIEYGFNTTGHDMETDSFVEFYGLRYKK